MPQSKNTAIALILFALINPAAQAESWICEQDRLVREISVKRETPQSAPCSVAYSKQSEGVGSEVLWTAGNDGSYCDIKANGLAEKLARMGWSCTAY